MLGIYDVGNQLLLWKLFCSLRSVIFSLCVVSLVHAYIFEFYDNGA